MVATKFFTPTPTQYPSLFAEGPDSNRSDRYTFVSTARIIEQMAERNMGITGIRIPNTRKADPAHARHEVSFAPLDDSMSFADPRLKVINHGTYHLDAAIVRPELRIMNSSDGTTSISAFIGMSALICANGLVVSRGTIGEIRMKHLGFDPEDVYSAIDQYVGKIPQIAEVVQTWGEREMSLDERIEFASQAREIRWPDKHFDPKLLLNTRRVEDKGTDLWATYNVVQENMIRGGFSPDLALGNGHKARKTRALVHIGKSNEINENLWDLAANWASN